MMLDKVYFDTLAETCPGAVGKFNAFIDEYKTSVGWLELFNAQEIKTDTYCNDIEAPKFYEIPFDLQVGVILLFVSLINRDTMLPQAFFCTGYDFEHFKYFFTEVMNEFEKYT